MFTKMFDRMSYLSFKKKMKLFLMMTFAFSALASTVVYASTNGLDPNQGLEMFSALISFLATWMGRIGGMVAFIGVIQFALATYNQSPEQRVTAMLVFVSGAMLLGVSLSYSFFINV